MIDLKKRFFSRVLIPEHPNHCWVWKGHKQGQGYGQMEIYNKTYSAHRLSYELNIGPIMTGNIIHHRCNNKSCVNPLHLEQTSSKRNTNYYQNDRKFTQKGENVHIDFGFGYGSASGAGYLDGDGDG